MRIDWTMSGVSCVGQHSGVHSRNRDRMRLFIGITFPKKQRERIHRAARVLREEEMPVRWVDLENYHLTLKFLGSTPLPRVEAIAALRETSSETAPIAL